MPASRGGPKEPPRAANYGSYERHLLEQYRLYVEMADRIAARRHTANTFFLTSNTAFVSFIALTWAKDTGFSLRIALVFVAVAGARGDGDRDENDRLDHLRDSLTE